MTGLRARQKADKNRRILEAAAQLFHSVGYDAARLEDIAHLAEVSVGTFYNYFENKGDLLLATVAMEVEEVLAAGQSVVNTPPPDVALALHQLITTYFDHSLVYLSKEMWRTAMALSIQQPSTPFSRRYTELDGLLRDQVCGLIAQLQANGQARRDVDARAIGEVIFNNLNLMFTEFAKADAMPVSELIAAVTRQNAPIAQLLHL
ncbi:MAG: TetR/AcrR family transcriptional regulator [Cypionkella sp.]|jgi:AcrR family transcriptional regulator